MIRELKMGSHFLNLVSGEVQNSCGTSLAQVTVNVRRCGKGCLQIVVCLLHYSLNALCSMSMECYPAYSTKHIIFSVADSKKL